MSLLRKIVICLLVNNIKLKALHIPGVNNTICDKLSRLQVPTGPVLRDGRHLFPVAVPQRLRPANLQI